ncbi:hypothetical protein [Luteipulveratus mongoliensis]|uniref:Uncharacterized protein n=1 Tax=Luteipulveratus mongoliensis TaxID=571913 RepID=A0A0K1JF25_9MICO|nr:hypothetical protein [Luteipulveratus mongoliensis]AKU15301.1 hypothetical protein VV02_04545 [Luteipulveratus mongoliensis]
MNTRRALAATLSVAGVAVLGVGSLPAADAAAAGVAKQTLRPASGVPMAVSGAYSPSALPTPASQTIRLLVGDDGQVRAV